MYRLERVKIVLKMKNFIGGYIVDENLSVCVFN